MLINWYRFDVIIEELKCEIHHCGHPNQEDGSHTHQDTGLSLELVETDDIKAANVPFGENVLYR